MKYVIEEADLKQEKENIIALWERNLPLNPEDRYEWFYESNPTRVATCMIAKDIKEGQVVGSIALFPRRLSMNGKTIIAGIAGDFSVAQQHRVFGPALSMQDSVISCCDGEKFDVIYGIPNKQSEKVFLKKGYKLLGNVLEMTRPLSSYYFLKKRCAISVIVKIISKPVDIVCKLLSKESYLKCPDDLGTEILTSFDERFDNLWTRASNQFSIIGERNSTYLNWRFASSPHGNYRIFILSKRKNDELLGYIVFRICEDGVYIDDLLAIDMEARLDLLLSEFLRFQKRKGIQFVSISFMGSQIFVEKLQKFGFSIRSEDDKVIIYVPSDSEYSPYLLEKENWYLMHGDNDV